MRGPQPGLATPAEARVLLPSTASVGRAYLFGEEQNAAEATAECEATESRVVAVGGLWSGNLGKAERDKVFEALVEACAPFGRVVDLVLPRQGEVAYTLYSSIIEAKRARDALHSGAAGWTARLIEEDDFVAIRQQDLTITSDAFELD